MKVRINATGDTIVMKFVRPNPDVKLEGYILGYGSSMFSKQFIQLPENGQPYETEMGTDTPALPPLEALETLSSAGRESCRRATDEKSPRITSALSDVDRRSPPLARRCVSGPRFVVGSDEVLENSDGENPEREKSLGIR